MSHDSDRKHVVKSLRQLTNILRPMFARWYSARRPSGGYFHSWVYAQAREFLEGVRIVVSDAEDYDLEESDLSHPRFAEGIEVPHVKLVKDGNGRPVIQGRISTSELQKLDRVGGFDVINDVHPIFAHRVEAPLELGAEGELEIVVQLEVRNMREPRTSTLV